MITLALDFTTASLDSRVTFTRTTGASNPATYTDSSGYITAATNDQPRFDYDPIALTCKGLLIEEPRTNRIFPSDGTGSFGNNTGLTLTSTTTPDNATVACVWNSGGDPANRYQIAIPANTFSSGQLIAWSWFQKKLDATNITFAISPGNPVNATVTTGATKLRDAGNGWEQWYAVHQITSGTSSTTLRLYINPLALGVSNAFAIWGNQVEAGAFATSYIPTTSAALTRNADVATMTGTNFSDWWQAGKGGAQVQVAPSTVSGIRPLVQFDDGTANEIIALRGNTTNPELYIVDGGTPQAQLDAGTIAANTPYSLTGWWQENNSFAQLNTQSSVRDNTVTIPTVTQTRIGTDGTNYLNGTIAAIYYYDELSNSIYDSLRLLGYTGTVTDMLLQYYLARGATSNSLTDAEIEFLGVKGFTTGTIDDRWTNYLISLGYSGTITDMKYQYWKSPE
jgi:hypothetical protein